MTLITAHWGRVEAVGDVASYVSTRLFHLCVAFVTFVVRLSLKLETRNSKHETRNCCISPVGRRFFKASPRNSLSTTLQTL